MHSPGSILLVDDEADFRTNISQFFESRGYETFVAEEGKSALALVKESQIDVAFVDMVMPGMDGMALLLKLKELNPFMEVVVMTGHGSIETAVEAIKNGAYNYVTKPVRLNILGITAQKAMEKSLLNQQVQAYRDYVRSRQESANGQIVAQSGKMKKVLLQAEKAAKTDMIVLIEGETGTGKEVVADFIHRHSNRSNQMLSILNCAALSENLVDAELFGYEKGAFTGAAEKRVGMIQVADGGTLFLDEISDIPLPAQVRLLRFLENGKIRRIGATREQLIDARIVAATNRNLEAEVANGKFRADLFHRIDVIRIQIPPLRDRPEDVQPLADHFMNQLRGVHRHEIELSDAAREELNAYNWPGNVREIAHCLERAVFAAQMDDSEQIRPDHLGLPQSLPSRNSALATLKEAEKRHVLAVLEHMDGNRKAAAAQLGVTERHLYRLIRQHQSTETPTR